MSMPEIKETVYNGMCETLDLEYLTAGWYEERDEQGFYQQKYWIDFIVIANLRGVYRRDASIGVAAIRASQAASDAEYRGCLVLNLATEEAFVGRRPFRHFPVDSEDMCLLSFLHRFDLMPEVRHSLMDELHGLETFSLEVFVPGGHYSATYAYGWRPQDPVSQAFWQELRRLVPVFARKTGDADVIDLVENRGTM